MKVEIHRKNSSESSEETPQLNKAMPTSINVHEAEMTSSQEHEPRYRTKINGNNYYFKKNLRRLNQSKYYKNNSSALEKNLKLSCLSLKCS